jgi:hypothetical protein
MEPSGARIPIDPNLDGAGQSLTASFGVRRRVRSQAHEKSAT